MSGPVEQREHWPSDMLCDLIHLAGMTKADIPASRPDREEALRSISAALRMPMGTFLWWLGGTSEWVAS